MVRPSSSDILRQLGRTTCGPAFSALTDGQLLDRFVGQRDQAAFELLLWRHGAMVLNVCWRVLRQAQEVEDAFQATFLTLARKAPSIARREAVVSWLYRVAFRVALAAKARMPRTCPDVRDLPDMRAERTPVWDDLRTVLDEEIHRLPTRYRLPVVLCYLENQTNEEAARRLGCPVGTVFSRLARGRALLRARLTRRGIALSTGLLTTLMCANAATANVTDQLVHAALKTAMDFGAGAAAAASPKVIAWRR